MRNFFLAAMAAVVLCGAGLGGALGQSSGDEQSRWMTVDNESAFEAVSIYIMPSKSRCCWSRDLLEDIVIPPRAKEKFQNKSRRIVDFDDGSGACDFHIRITTRYPGWEWLFYNIKVCEVPDGKLPSSKAKSQGAKAKTNHKNDRLILRGDPPISKDEKPKNRWMVIHNRSQLAVQQVFIIPSWENEKAEEKKRKRKDCCWSYDLLPIDKIAHSKKHLVNFDDGSGTCTFDIRITSDKEQMDWYLEQVDVCSNSVLLLKDPGKQRKVTIINESQFDAFTVRTKPADKADKDCCWSDDLLGKEIIGKGKFLDVDFDDGTGTCSFEYSITKRTPGRPWVGQIDACSAPSSPFPTIKLAPLEGSKDGKHRLVTIKNESGVDAVELHTKSKGKDCCWSDDFLGEEIVRNGKSLDVDFDDGAGTCEFEYRISKRTGQSWVSQIDVCHGQTDKRPVITLLKEQP